MGTLIYYVYLSLGEVQRCGDFYSPGPTQILAEMEFLLEFQELSVGIRGPKSPG